MGQATFLAILASLTLIAGAGVLLMLRRRRQVAATIRGAQPPPASSEPGSPPSDWPLEDENPLGPKSAKICPRCGLHYRFGRQLCPRDDAVLRPMH